MPGFHHLPLSSTEQQPVRPGPDWVLSVVCYFVVTTSGTWQASDKGLRTKCKIVALGVAACPGGGGHRIMLPSLSRRALSTLHHYDKDLR